MRIGLHATAKDSLTCSRWLQLIVRLKTDDICPPSNMPQMKTQSWALMKHMMKISCKILRHIMPIIDQRSEIWTIHWPTKKPFASIDSKLTHTWVTKCALCARLECRMLSWQKLRIRTGLLNPYDPLQTWSAWTWANTSASANSKARVITAEINKFICTQRILHLLQTIARNTLTSIPAQLCKQQEMDVSLPMPNWSQLFKPVSTWKRMFVATKEWSRPTSRRLISIMELIVFDKNRQVHSQRSSTTTGIKQAPLTKEWAALAAIAWSINDQSSVSCENNDESLSKMKSSK